MSAKILIVEDNPLNLKLIRDVLEFQGFDVITARSGEEGVAMASDASPDLVLMDLQLPGIDGHEALQRIHADPRCRDVPIVAVTAFAMKDDIERAEAAGFAGYIAKPISVRALPAQIARFLPWWILMPDQITILAVDDQPQNLRLLEAVLSPRGYRIVTATSGEQAIEMLSEAVPDLVLLDIVMPGVDGYEVCRRIRENPATAYLPVVMITASNDQEKLTSLRAGADDFISKPLNQGELLARVASLARIKRYQDTINSQAEELKRWNAELESRVQAQVEDLQRVNRLRRFLSPQLVKLMIDSGDEDFLRSHRREIVVVFCDIRGFTSFAESSEPEEVMGVLQEYHEASGELIFAYEGTLERFTGDGLMVVFNDPLPIDDAPARALRMSVAMRDRIRALAGRWRRRGYDLALGIGVAQGFATLGRIGFEGRFDYAAIGSVANLAARLCDTAGPWQILASQRVFYAAEPVADGTPIGELELKGFSRAVPAFEVSSAKGEPPE